MRKSKKIVILFLVMVVGLMVVGLAAGTKIYMDVKKTVEKAYEPVERAATHRVPEDLGKNTPFSVLLLGIDTGDFDRTDVGRSDTMILATVNPIKEETLLLSLPRDIYADIIGHDTKDKWNHAYAFGGAAMSMDTVEQFLDVPVDYYISLNMGGFKDLVDAVGGVNVVNSKAFTMDGQTFDVGELSLNGEQALAYSRMRKEDPEGDFGRQARQRQLAIAIMQKMLSIGGITQYEHVLNALGDNMKTDLTFDQMKYLTMHSYETLTNVVSDQLKAEGFMQDDIYYQRVAPEELARVKEELEQQLN